MKPNDAAAPAHRIRSRPSSPPYAFYVLVTFFLATPLLLALLWWPSRERGLSDEGIRSLLKYTPFALGLVGCMVLMRKQPVRGTDIAAWFIHLATLTIILDLLFSSSPDDDPWPIFNCGSLMVFAVIGAANVYAARTSKAWRD